MALRLVQLSSKKLQSKVRDEVMGMDHAVKRNVGESMPTPANQAEIDTLMRRFLDQNRQNDVENTAPKSTPAVAQGIHPRRDFEMASDLLDRASQAFDLLINRCQRLEREVSDAHETAEARIAEQAETTEQWKRLASGLKVQMEASEKSTAALQARCDAAEARAAMAEQRATSLERASAHAASQAALAEQQSIKLHDRVVSAFGIGSRAHPVLEAVATRQAAE